MKWYILTLLFSFIWSVCVISCLAIFDKFEYLEHIHSAYFRSTDIRISKKRISSDICIFKTQISLDIRNTTIQISVTPISRYPCI
jgi:hypothetical protein